MDSNKLCIEYAENRERLKATNKAIMKILDRSRKGIDLYSARSYWIVEKYTWHGWVRALEHSGKYTQSELDLAKLLDIKSGLRKQAGNIKRKIAMQGRVLISKREVKMKQIIIEQPKESTIDLDLVSESTPIFVKRNGKLVGFVYCDTALSNAWLILIGGTYKATGYYVTRLECLLSGLKHGYTYYVED